MSTGCRSTTRRGWARGRAWRRIRSRMRSRPRRTNEEQEAHCFLWTHLLMNYYYTTTSQANFLPCFACSLPQHLYSSASSFALLYHYAISTYPSYFVRIWTWRRPVANSFSQRGNTRACLFYPINHSTIPTMYHPQVANTITLDASPISQSNYLDCGGIKMIREDVRTHVPPASSSFVLYRWTYFVPQL